GYLVARLNTNGTLDTSFGSGGIVFTQLGTSTSTDRPFDLSIQKDGKIVVAGQSSYGVSRAFGLVRYNVGVAGQPDGSLDNTFGSGGIVLTPTTFDLDDMALQADGKIVVVAQSAGSSGDNFQMARYNVGVAGQPDGSLDSTFGSGGIATITYTGSGTQV